MTDQSHLCSIEVAHEYFSLSGACSVNAFWAPSSLALAGNMGLMLKPHLGGASLRFRSHVFDSVVEMLQAFSDEQLVLVVRPEHTKEFGAVTQQFNVKDNQVACFDFTQENSTTAPELQIKEIGQLEFVQQDAIYSLGFKRARTDLFVFISSPQLLAMMPDNDAAFEDETGLPINLQLKLRSYETYLKYYLFGYEQSDELSIVDADNRVDFDPCQHETHDGRVAKVFMSKDVLPVQYRAKRRFQLVRQGISRATVVIDSLPLPKLGHYFVADINGKEVMVSEAFVN